MSWISTWKPAFSMCSTQSPQHPHQGVLWTTIRGNCAAATTGSGAESGAADMPVTVSPLGTVVAVSWEQAARENRMGASHRTDLVRRVFMGSPRGNVGSLIGTEQAEHGNDHQDQKGNDSFQPDAQLQMSDRSIGFVLEPVQPGRQSPAMQGRQDKHGCEERELERHQPPIVTGTKRSQRPAEKLCVR